MFPVRHKLSKNDARSILILYSTSPAQLFPLVLQTLYQCSLEEPYQRKLRLGVTANMRRISQKVHRILSSFLFYFNANSILRWDCIGYLGSRPFESTIEKRDDRSGFGFSASFREGNIFPSLARTRHYRAFV